MNETLVCTLTGNGRSAVAVIGLHGTKAQGMLAECFEPATNSLMHPGQIRFGMWRSRLSQVARETTSTSQVTSQLHGMRRHAESNPSDGESVVVTPIAADHLEIHCHGGSAAIAQILRSLTELGAREVSQSEWPKALLLGEEGKPLILETEQVLTKCTTARAAAIALDQTRGLLLQWVEKSIVTILTDAHASASGLAEVQAEANELLNRSQYGLRLTEPFRIVLAGPPNVGKSSLVNRLVGYQRSITHDAEGTTRDVLESSTVVDGHAIQLSDTAGIRSGGDVIEQEGIRRGARAIAEADMLVLVVDPASLDQLSDLRCSVETHGVPMIQVLNKADLIQTESQAPVSGMLQTIAEQNVIADQSFESSDRDDGISDLLKTIASMINEMTPASGVAVPVCERQVEWLQIIATCGDLNTAKMALHALRDGTPCQPTTTFSSTNFTTS